jgi:hypothetical protein
MVARTKMRGAEGNPTHYEKEKKVELRRGLNFVYTESTIVHSMHCTIFGSVAFRFLLVSVLM